MKTNEFLSRRQFIFRRRYTPAVLMFCITLLCLGFARASHADPAQPELIDYKQTKNADGEAVTLQLHVFKPAGWSADDDRPVIVFFFGGGWNSGSPTQFYPHCEELASRGMVAISAEYRVRRRNGTPPQACVADGKSAIRYIRSHANELGIDPDRVVAGGGSAGGHVAASTALVQGFDEAGEDTSVSCVPQLMVLFNPVIETVAPDGYGTGRLGDDAAALSPTRGIHDDQPPSVIFHGEADTTVPVRLVRRFAELSEEAGATCTLHTYPGQPHGFFNLKKPEQPDAPENASYHDSVAKMVAFLAEHGYITAESAE